MVGHDTEHLTTMTLKEFEKLEVGQTVQLKRIGFFPEGLSISPDKEYTIVGKQETSVEIVDDKGKRASVHHTWFYSPKQT